MIDVELLIDDDLDPLKLHTVIDQLTPTLRQLDRMPEGRAILHIMEKAQKDLELYINAIHKETI